MSMMDRDWYRAELAQRERRLRRAERRRRLRIATAAMAIVPLTITSRCDLNG
jgi:hypothetical protein